MDVNMEGHLIPLSKAKKLYLKELYENPSRIGSLGGLQSLYKEVKRENRYHITLDQVRKWLQENETYTLHKPLRRKFIRNRVIVGDINQQWDIDIGDMQKFKKKNKNFNYFLLAIDVLSKYVRTVALKTKSAKEVTSAFQNMISDGQVPATVHSDRGKEFTNYQFQKLLKKFNIKHFFTNNELKAMVAERAIKTLKLKLFKYMTASRKYNWVDVLPKITSTYNSTVNRSIGVAPKSVNIENSDRIWEKLYPNVSQNKPTNFKFELNDKVRVSYFKKTFERAYDYFWSGEIFVIIDRFFKENIPKYKLKDWNNEPIDGSFYEEELQKISIPENETYRVEKIIGRRVRGGRREVKVKWLMWPSKFNSWIPANSLKNYS